MRTALAPRIAALLLLAAGAVTAEEAPEPVPGPELCVLETSMGRMVFELFDEGAPATVASFKRLVRDGFYDGRPFYRVVAGHVIQAGDGGENDQPTVPGELGVHPHVRGALGLARGEDPDSGSTEIYICHADRPHLDGHYAVFGMLVEGFDVLDAIAAVEVEEQWLGEEGTVAFHRPSKPVIIERANLVSSSEGD